VPDPWFDELSELLAIPSVSADPERKDDVTRAAEWLAGFIRDAGGSAEVVPTDTQPLILGDLGASNGLAPTVLVYGHVDVQPPDPLELWESDPFTLEQRGEWLYGRGVVDDKGQLYMLAKAAAELSAAGELAILEHQAQEPVRPVERQRRHLEQANEVAGRRRIYHDPFVRAFGQRVAKPDERVELIDAWWCEREQLPRDRAIVRRVEPGTQQSIERSVHAGLVFRPPSREG